MYCTNCGAEREDNATFCPGCSARIRKFAPAAPIPNYLLQAIGVTFCCCFPFGIVALVFSAGVNSKVMHGDIAGAQEASRKAKLWCWISFGLGLVLWLVYAGFVAFSISQNN